MRISELKDLLSADVMTSDEDLLDGEVYNACCSDMMSDVLAFVKDQGVLLTGLINEQVIRTASMMDMVCVVIVRGKSPTEDMLTLAEACDIVVMKTKLRAYEACGKLYTSGLVAREPQG